MNFSDNIKFFGKYFIIVLMTFLILKFIVNLKVYEAILLGLIITVSVLIIESIINPQTLSSGTTFMPNPYDCSKCKIETDETRIVSNFSNIVPQISVVSEENLENFTTNERVETETQTSTPYDSIKAIDSVIKNITSSVKSNLFPKSETGTETSTQIISLVDKTNDDFEFKCVRVNKNPIETFGNVQQTSGPVPIDELENFINDQNNITQSMVSEKKTVDAKQSQSTKPNVKANAKTIEEQILQEGPITYDASYVQYQTDGLEKEQGQIVLKEKEFKLDIGEPSIVKPFIQDGKNYYGRIKSYSGSAPESNEALTNELKYGDYNYIGPLNNGMINPDYTFVSPNNWYPVPPHAPVCVTNKKCTTCPIQMSDGKDYMNWASLEDFDSARRFTGNMGINIDYVKNVLNNDNGY